MLERFVHRRSETEAKNHGERKITEFGNEQYYDK